MTALDSLGRPVPAGTVGKIVIRELSMTSDYRNHPEANRAAFASGGTGPATWAASRETVTYPSPDG